MNNKKKTKIVAAVTAGACFLGLYLVGSSTTFSAWSDSANVATANVVNGNLDVEAANSTWKDARNNTDIDIATFRAVPGDILEYKTGLKVALEGNNLQAKLKLDGGEGAVFQNLAAQHGWKIGYKIGTTDGGHDILNVAPTHDIARLQEGAVMTPQTAGVVADIAQATNPNIFVTVRVEFDPATPNQVLVKQTQALKQLGVTLEQVLPSATTSAPAPAPGVGG